MNKDKFSKNNLIKLIESFSKLFYYGFLLFCFLFGNVLVIVLIYLRIFSEEKYDKFLELIKDLKDENGEDEFSEETIEDENETQIKQYSAYGNEDEDENYDELDGNDYDEIDEDSNIEDDIREMSLYKYIRNGMIISYYSYGITIFSTLYIFFPNSYVLFFLFLGYCIGLKQLFKFLFGFNINLKN